MGKFLKHCEWEHVTIILNIITRHHNLKKSISYTISCELEQEH